MNGQNLRQHGDLFESTQYEWIKKRFPLYEEVWMRFIGNNGQNRPFKIKDLTSEQDAAHKLFFQSHYSLALYSYLFDHHADDATTALSQSVEAGTHKSIDSHLRDMKNFSLYLALLGQICDMVESIAKALKQNEIAEKIVEFAKQRSNAIHAARIPVMFDPYGVQIAPIAKLNPKDGEWKKFATWDSVSVTKFEYLEDWMRGTRDELFRVLKVEVFPIVRKAALARFGREVDRASAVSAKLSTFTQDISSTDQTSDQHWKPPRIPSGDGRDR